MDRLVHTHQFERAYELDPINTYIHFAILSGNTVDIEKWIDATLKKEVGELSLRKLRDLASRLGILFYTSYSKADLIRKIIEAQNDRRLKEIALAMPSGEERTAS